MVNAKGSKGALKGSRSRGVERKVLPQENTLPWGRAAAIFGAVAAVGLFIKGLIRPVHYLSTYNREQMRDVFLGNDTWVVLCSGGLGGGSGGEGGLGGGPVAGRFNNAARNLKSTPGSSDVKFGLVDCTGSLPSGKSILQKFDLDESVKPVLFVTGGGMKPVQASSRNMETNTSLLKWVRLTAEPHAAPVTSTRELESKCLKKEACALILKAGPLEDRVKEAFKGLMHSHRNMKFVSVDSTKLEVSVEKKLGIKPFLGAHQLLNFVRYNVTDKPKVGTPRWGLSVYDGPLEGGEMSLFLDEVTEGKRLPKPTPITRLPTVLTRKEPKSPKAEPEPSARRGGGGGGKGEGEGEGEGGLGSSGRSEGDVSGNGYEGKTKEDILEEFRVKQAEREAARRQQMDEEAAGFLFEGVEDDEESGGQGGEGEDGGRQSGGGGGSTGGEWVQGGSVEEEGLGEEDEEEFIDLDEL